MSVREVGGQIAAGRLKSESDASKLLFMLSVAQTISKVPEALTTGTIELLIRCN